MPTGRIRTAPDVPARTSLLLLIFLAILAAAFLFSIHKSEPSAIDVWFPENATIINTDGGGTIRAGIRIDSEKAVAVVCPIGFQALPLATYVVDANILETEDGRSTPPVWKLRNIWPIKKIPPISIR